MGLKIVYDEVKIFEEIRVDLAIHDKNIRLEMDKIGEEAEKQIKDIIKDGKVRPQEGEPTTLEDNMKLEKFENGWGLGNIAILDKVAKYWRAINFGSSHMVGKKMPPYFTPGKTQPSSDNFREGRVNYNGSKGQGGGVVVTKAIQPMNFISRTIKIVSEKFNKLRVRK